MLKLQGQRRQKRKFYKKIALFSAIFLAVILIRPTWNISKKYLESQSELELAEQELIELKERQIFLNAQLAKLNTESGLEEEVVKKFDLVREGEELAVIVEPEPPPPAPVEEKGFIKKFMEKYFGWLY